MPQRKTKMTDKEFKRLSRAQLIEIIYQLQLQTDNLTEQNNELKKELADKRLRINEAGNIANASLAINNCFQSAQAAADQYLDEIRAIRDEAEEQKNMILSEARARAAEIIAEAVGQSGSSLRLDMHGGKK
jgi:cell division septum initiation protein DivIVA